jgi:hypothetical protein
MTELSKGEAAWNLLCTRLGRDPTNSEETDTCSLRSAWKAILAYDAALQSQCDHYRVALEPFEREWEDMGIGASLADDMLMLDADGVGGEILTVGHWRTLMAARSVTLESLDAAGGER